MLLKVEEKTLKHQTSIYTMLPTQTRKNHKRSPRVKISLSNNFGRDLPSKASLLSVISNVLLLAQDNLFEEKLLYYFQNTNDIIECMRVVNAIMIMTATVRVRNRNILLFENLNNNEVLLNLNSNIKNDIMYLRSQLPSFLSKLPKISEYRRVYKGLRYETIQNNDCIIRFDNIKYKIKFQDFWKSFCSLKTQSLNIHFQTTLQSYQDQLFPENRNNKIKDLISEIADLDNKISQLSNNIILKRMHQTRKKEKESVLESLQTNIYFHDFFNELKDSIEKIKAACDSVNYITTRVPQIEEYTYEPDPNFVPRQRTWSNNDQEVLASIRYDATNEIQTWSSTSSNKETKESNAVKKKKEKFDEQEYNSAVLVKLYNDMENTNNPLKKEYYRLAIAYFNIITSKMSIENKVRCLMSSYTTPKYLLRQVKNFVGIYEERTRDGNIIIVHRHPFFDDTEEEEETKYFSAAYSSNHVRRRSIKNAWSKKEIKQKIQKAIDNLEENYSSYRYESDLALKNVTKKELRKIMIFKAFEILFKNRYVDQGVIENIFNHNNFEFLYYVQDRYSEEENITGIKNSYLGSRLMNCN